MLGFRKHPAGSKPLAGCGLHHTGDIRLNDAKVPQGKAQGELAHLLHVFPGVGLVGLNNYVAHAHLLNQGHDLLPGAGSNGEHGNHRSHAKNHPQHSEQGAQLVHEQVLESKAEVGKVLAPGAGRDQRIKARRFHWPTPSDGEEAPCFLTASSGFTSATSAPSGRFSKATLFSVRNLIFASVASNFSPCFTYTTSLPSLSNRHWLGRYSWSFS